jgi:voltage-gated potassium channel
MMPAPSPLLRSSRTTLLYVVTLLREFRWSLVVLAAALLVATIAFYLTPDEFAQAQRPDNLLNAVYAAWMAMLVQPVNSVGTAWYISIIYGLYPVIGLIVVGEGIVRLALLIFSKRHGQKEWMRVMAATYRDHVVLCGVGHLGIRVLEELLSAGESVVAVERDGSGQFVEQAKRTGTPVIIGDMKDDETLIVAGIPHARVVIVATNDDMGNLEVALDSRRLNPKIRVVMRLFEQSIAKKISNAFLVDVAFSPSSLAAPMVAAMSIGARVLGSTLVANIPHVTAELTIEPGSEMVGKRVEEIERGYGCKVLARTPPGAPLELPPGNDAVIGIGDGMVVHMPSAQLATLAAASRGGATVGAR